ncbi:FecCD family ABC transporter permease [Streptomyces zingiberis]|uniref:Iron chelate uptake ABC transporter family permease subunit n=1 Tax=Streptomyces zingiberis TaxID=2053010 RepID=A0ABX1C336_9ACTN|nr:iron chelate uptake ABC transporter family permease subunit [Streptomyces zingiberis]NJQ03848.1 iron chelate uptake ABC transporter family permease subunit [Streptomyces zingiberis]
MNGRTRIPGPAGRTAAGTSPERPAENGAVESGAVDSGAPAPRAPRTPGGPLRTVRIGHAVSFRFRPRAVVVTVSCLLVALAAGVLSLGSGEFPMGPAEVVRALAGAGTPAQEFIVGELRLPRVLAALLTGAALALSGAVFQSVVRNPLGSPDLLGVTQGAATGALVVVITGGSSAALAGGAVTGGLLTGVLIYALSWRQGMHGFRLVLTGIGVLAMLTGVNGYLLTRGELMEASRAVLWLTGSLDGRGWPELRPLLAAVVVLGPVTVLGCGRALRLAEMGDDSAHALGVNVERVRLVALGSAVALASFAAACAGPVSFVALTAPQLARRLTRAPGPGLLPAACMGAALLVAADWAAQHAFGERQLPVGVITGLLGGGYLVWLLAGQRRAGRI